MRVFRNRVILFIGLSLFTLLGYWSGLGQYLRILTSMPTPSLTNLDETQITVINNFNAPLRKPASNSAKVDNRTPNAANSGAFPSNVDNRATSAEKSNPASTIIDNRISVADKSSLESITVHTINTPASTSSKPLTNINGSHNKTLYILPFNFRKGRLGNQMFRYASLIGIARAQGRKLIVFPPSELQKTFQIQHVDYMEESNGWRLLRESNPFNFDPNMMKLPATNLRIDGYFQSHVYIADVDAEVRQAFTFLDYISNAADAILRDVKTKYGTSLIVGVHVRRGDFIRHEYRGYGVPEQSYFLKAFDCIKSNFSGTNITFLIASDDLPWCNDNLVGNGVILMPRASAAVHLAVLSICDHVIISGGSFGWWGGWLAGGKVIYYTGYMTQDTSVGRLFNAQMYYPKLWIGLGD